MNKQKHEGQQTAEMRKQRKITSITWKSAAMNEAIRERTQVILFR
jgi:hypothetical protein